MRSFERELKLTGWESEFASVQKLLDYLSRKTGSEASRLHYLETIYHLCRAVGKNPDELIHVQKSELEQKAQSFLDRMNREKRSIRYINVSLAHLVMFFRVNGFKNGRELELERYTQPTRYRKAPEYIPTSEEIARMATYAGSVKSRALVLATYTSGLRNSTLRAILYRDVKAELDSGNDVVHVSVYPEMKKVTPNAAKGSIPYESFFSKEAVDAIKAYLAEFAQKHKDASLRDDEPLFQGQIRGRPIKARTLQVVVKGAARRAGLQRWKDVYPHCLRKAFENAIRNSGMDSKDQIFLEGHVLPGSEDAYYDKTRIEEFRQKYRKVMFLPAIQSGEEARKQSILDTLRLLSGLGVTPELTDAIRREVELAPAQEAQTITEKVIKYLTDAGRPVSLEELQALFSESEGEGRLAKALEKKDKLAISRKTMVALANPQGFCTQCGRALKAKARFCGFCGAEAS